PWPAKGNRMKVESRESKLLVNHEPCADPSQAVQAVWDEIEEAAKTLPMVGTKDPRQIDLAGSVAFRGAKGDTSGADPKGKLAEEATRTIIFLDTPDHTLPRNGLGLRQRGVDESVESTLAEVPEGKEGKEYPGKAFALCQPDGSPAGYAWANSVDGALVTLARSLGWSAAVAEPKGTGPLTKD